MDNRFGLQSYGGYLSGTTLPKIEESKHGQLYVLTSEKGTDVDLYVFDAHKREWKLVGGNSSSGSGNGCGGVFFIDCEPDSTGNVGDKVFDDIGVQLKSFTTDTNMVRLKILAITGISSYIPNVKTEDNVSVPLTPLIDRPLFEGWVTVNITGKKEYTVEHEDGGKDTIEIKFEDKPKVLSAQFIGEYQNGQSELKSDDKHKLEIKTDKSIVKVEVDNYGCAKPNTYTVSGNNIVIDLTIANRGNVSSLHGVKFRVVTANGSTSEWFTTDSMGNVEKVNVLKLNNTYPTINVTTIDYPIGQKALKNNESATIDHTITNYDTVVYSSNGELSITNPNVYETSKIVQRVSGNYNVSVTNFKIEATRNANGAKTIVNKVINIANISPTITIEKQFPKFQSSDVGESYWIKIKSNQQLLNTPSLNLPHGIWNGTFTSTDDVNWTNYIKVFDSDTKGIHSLFGLLATGLSGLTTTIITGDSTYELAGFKQKRIYFPPFSPITPLNVVVTDVSKLVVVDTGGYTLNFIPSKTATTLGYTVTNSSGDIIPPLDHVYLLDNGLVTQNSTGTYFIDIQEGI